MEPSKCGTFYGCAQHVVVTVLTFINYYNTDTLIITKLITLQYRNNNNEIDEITKAY